MPPLVQTKTATKGPKKKTKSRNGCSRCKLKRLKCDETAPACLQCKKRNVPCPGYEKTLKWSTKYEVLQPILFEPVSVCNPTSTANAPAVKEITLPPDVVSGFEALAAVLPIGNRKPELQEKGSTEQHIQLNDADDEVSVGQNEAQDIIEPPKDSDPPSIDPIGPADPNILDEFLQDSESLPEEFSFYAPFDSLDFLEPTALEELELDIEEVEKPIDETIIEPSNSRVSRSLLLEYYRLPSPSPSSSSLDEDIGSILVQHYFRDVCVLFSTFDSLLNPYRTTIGRVFQDSPSIYYAIQSMAAAHLANTFPNMTATGIEMQRKACECLQAELPLVQSGSASGGRTLLSIILLGITTCWHESSALGEEFLTTARSLILPQLLNSSQEEEAQRQNQFFEESLIYWEMLMGFVTQDGMTNSPAPGVRNRVTPKKTAPVARRRDGKIVPHPWTGIAPTVQMLFAEVGRLVRRERMLHINGAPDIRRMQENLLNAATLEEDLLAAEYPMADELADPGDERTAKRDFVVMAEAYRCAGLLEIYRVFPSILRKRLGTEKLTWSDNVEFEFPTPRFETPYEDTDTKLWINSLALHILSALETLPSSSGTCCTQPIIFAAAASELRFVSSVDYFDIYANDAKVLHARQFVETRLNEYALWLPAKPIRKIIELVMEVWRRLDDGQNAFWIDVMVEKGWHTVMG
ncbi:hypothetical protein K469DRAFT_723328 [Zopfia rhizophila CBS 207.26]|uniref:Zn(2)-C6 fungal-type domain-containing protein n=1 Tax=Zopfia rhizophila CBS 207.26 TaxID=1314779 RepID=A0A6A6D9J9_9PEZI|nr:hypothetical protein K469DRAFT_723328 [Zopfia rhizophila CBS 207.26]